MNQWFVINDIDEFVDRVRAIVYNKFGSWDEESELDEFALNISQANKEELDNILSHSEALIIAKQSLKKQKNSKTKSIRYVLDDNIFADIVHDLNTRMVSNLLTSLVEKGLVESGYDSEANDFVFWVKDDKQEKPETD